MEDILLKFILELNVDKWGKYKKGDRDTFFIKLLDERCGLVRHPIDKHWTIISCDIENK